MDHAWFGASLGKDALDPLFLPDAPRPADVLDREVVLFRQLLGVGPDFFAERLCPLRVVEDPDPFRSEMLRHALWETDVGQCAGQKNPVEARKDTSDLRGVTVREQLLGHGESSLGRSPSFQKAGPSCLVPATLA